MKNNWIALAFCSVLSVNALAAGTSCHSCPPPVYDGGFNLGVAWADNIQNTFLATLGYNNHYFTALIGGMYERVTNSIDTNFSSSSFSEFKGLVQLGLRKQIVNNFYFDFGASGSQIYFSNKAAGIIDPYTVGAFAGLSWQPMRHLLLNARIEPFTYEKELDRTKEYEFFAHGLVSMSYVF